MKYLDILQENESSFYNSMTYIFFNQLKKRKKTGKKKRKKQCPGLKDLKDLTTKGILWILFRS